MAKPASGGYQAIATIDHLPVAPISVSGSVLPLRRPSSTVNLIKAVQDNGIHAIDELNNQIADIDERKARLLAERETIRKMLTIAEEHKDHVQR